MTATEPPPHPELATARASLAELLDEQHRWLCMALTQLPELLGSARDDAFLLLRRRLAVHQAVVSLSQSGREPELTIRVAVLAAEQHDPRGPAFEAALERLLEALWRSHERASTARADLPLCEEPLVAATRELWRGEGGAPLGDTYRYMLAAALDELRGADRWPASPSEDV